MHEQITLNRQTVRFIALSVTTYPELSTDGTRYKFHGDTRALADGVRQLLPNVIAPSALTRFSNWRRCLDAPKGCEWRDGGPARSNFGPVCVKARGRLRPVLDLAIFGIDFNRRGAGAIAPFLVD